MSKKENTEYEEFVDKFKPKLTTDDCYTPPEVYDVVLNYVKEKCDIADLEVVRPFYPGGDFENYNYPKNCVVIDNPPFSIFAQIIRFYIENDIKFFLFGPHLTILGTNQDYTAIITDADIVYHNGAVIKTAFVSNLFSEAKVIGDSELGSQLNAINEGKKVNLPKYEYPENILTVSMISQFVAKGISVKFDKKDVTFCRGLDSQKKMKKAIFGSGLLINKRALMEKRRAEKLRAEKLAAEYLQKEKARIEKEGKTIWELSDRELQIINSLN